MADGAINSEGVVVVVIVEGVVIGVVADAVVGV